MRSLRLAAAVAVLACWARGAAAVEPGDHPEAPAPIYRRIEASIGYHYSAGDYGTSDTTQIMYVPLVVTGELGRWMLQGTIPFLYIDGPAGLIEGPNGPIQTNDGTSDGLGDLLLRGSYIFPTTSLVPIDWGWDPWLPFVETIGLVKFPTASESDGLGTGEFDFGIDVELTWVIAQFTPFVTAGYRFLGSSSEIPLHDVFVGSIGGLYQFLDTLSAGALIEYRQAPSASTGERLEVVPFATWRFLYPWKLEGYVSAGLADGSPDVGVGTQLAYTW